jgi:hypothetical protein
LQAQSLTADQIVERMTERNLERAERLQHVTSIRRYHLEYHGFPGDRAASMEVEAQFDAPGSKSFRVLSQTGSKLLIDRVLKKLLESESDATKHQHNSDLTLANYKFELKGTEKNANASYYVLAVEPRAASTYLYRSQVWGRQRFCRGADRCAARCQSLLYDPEDRDPPRLRQGGTLLVPAAKPDRLQDSPGRRRDPGHRLRRIQVGGLA